MIIKHDGCVGCINEMKKVNESKDCRKCKYNYMDMYQARAGLLNEKKGVIK